MKGIITKETSKYIYTQEVIRTMEKNYFIKLVNGYDCTVYKTEEEAKAAIPATEKLWNTKATGVFFMENERMEVKNHRYTKK